VAQSQQELQTLLSEFPGVTDAYFQKPGNLTLVPDYIVYEIDDEYVLRADDRAFAFFNKYTVTLVTRDQECPVKQLIRDLPYASFDRMFIAGGLYHFVYNLYF